MKVPINEAIETYICCRIFLDSYGLKIWRGEQQRGDDVREPAWGITSAGRDVGPSVV